MYPPELFSVSDKPEIELFIATYPFTTLISNDKDNAVISHVPTWNYATVHCMGKMSFVKDDQNVFDLITELVAIYEGAHGWQLPQEDRFKQLQHGIRFFSIEAPTFKAIYKFNQNKSKEDIDAVINALSDKGLSESANFMAQINNE